jgi:two-component system sensor histidine kinase PhoQ
VNQAEPTPAAAYGGRVYSLSRRLLVSVSIALVVFFGLTAIALDAIFRDLAQRSLRELLDAQLVALIAAAETDDLGRVAGASTSADSRLQTPGSGLYAEIRNRGGASLWRSPSAAGTFLDFTASTDAVDAAVAAPQVKRLDDGRRVAIAARSISWEYANGREPQQLVFAVASSMQSYDEQLGIYRTRLFGGLVVAGLLVLGTVALLLGWLTSPMRRLQQEIEAVEAGRLPALGRGYPRELAGVADGLNTLLQGERRRIQRYRDTLGNLAHSLKTPLAVIRNAMGGAADVPAVRAQVGAEVERMQDIIEHQLRRAATSGRVIGQQPVDVAPIVQQLRVAMLKVHARKDFVIELALTPGTQFIGDAADLTEALGNVVDNACKWCRSRVRIEAASDAAGALRMVVDDDGPGMPDELRNHGPERGRRADESTPGHGIGLAMVADTAELYGGRLALEPSPLGGARVVLELPGARQH